MLSKPWKPRRKRMFAALGETFLPPVTPGGWHGGDATSLAILENFYRTGPGLMRLAFLATLWTLELTPLLTIGKFATFSSLSPEHRLQHLRIFSSTEPWAVLFAPLRAVVAIAVYSRPEAMAHAGYQNNGRSRESLVSLARGA